MIGAPQSPRDPPQATQQPQVRGETLDLLWSPPSHPDRPGLSSPSRLPFSPHLLSLPCHTSCLSLSLSVSASLYDAVVLSPTLPLPLSPSLWSLDLLQWLDMEGGGSSKCAAHVVAHRPVRPSQDPPRAPARPPPAPETSRGSRGPEEVHCVHG